MKKNLLLAIAVFCITFTALILSNDAPEKDSNKQLITLAE
jgi:hypothetical protein